MANINKIHTSLRNVKPNTDILITITRPGYRVFQNIMIKCATIEEHDDETSIDPVLSTSFIIRSNCALPTVFGYTITKHTGNPYSDTIAIVDGYSVKFPIGCHGVNQKWTHEFDIVNARESTGK